MGSGGRHSSFWCDACQGYVPFSNHETLETNCMYCEAKANKARAEAAEARATKAEAEVNRLLGLIDLAVKRPADWQTEAARRLTAGEMAVALLVLGPEGEGMTHVLTQAVCPPKAAPTKGKRTPRGNAQEGAR